MTMLLSGIFPAITTPFYPDGQVYYRKLEHNVHRYAMGPLAGIVALGSTGEAPMLSDEEKRGVLKCAIESAAPEKVMIAGAGAESAIETLRMAEFAASLGYDVAMVRTPHFYKTETKPANILAFYRFVADRSPVPVVIYNIPQATGYDIPVEVVAELAEHENIAAIKESSGSIAKVQLMVERTRHIKREATVTERFEAVTGRMLKAATAAKAEGELVPVGALAGTASQTPQPVASKPSSSAVQVVGNLKTRKKNVGFQVMVGAAQKLYPSLEAGAAGAILAFADAAPTACFEVYAAFKDGDKPLAQLKQERIAKAAQRIAAELSIPGVKYAMELNGYYGGNARLPMLPLTAETKREIEPLMENIRS